MYKCNHCNITIPDDQTEGHIVKAGPKFYCAECGDPVVYIPDAPKVAGTMMGAQATLISNSDNRITTNNYYGGMPDDQVETQFGKCKRSDARFCKHCQQWVPFTFFNEKQLICSNCEAEQIRKDYDDGQSFFNIGLYDEATTCFLKYLNICPNEEQSKVKTLIGKCYYELKYYKEALKYFVVASRDNLDSLYYLGNCYFNGYGISKNIKTAIDCFRDAAQKGHDKSRKEIENIDLSAEKGDNGLWGYKSPDGTIVIDYQYQEAGKFSEGLARVMNSDGKWGYIDKCGNIILPFQWHFACAFFSDEAKVGDENDRRYVINKEGNILKEQCSSCKKWLPLSQFRQGLTICTDCEKKEVLANYDKGCQLLEDGLYPEALSAFQSYEKVCPQERQKSLHGFLGQCYFNIRSYQQALIHFESAGDDDADNLYYHALCYYQGLGVTKNCVKAIELLRKSSQKGNFEAEDFLEDLELTETVDANDRWGYANEDGDIVIPCQWKDADAFFENLAFVKDVNDRYGFIDKTGHIVIPCQWKDADEFEDGLARVQDFSDKWYYIDKKGATVWEDVGPMKEGLARVCDSNGKYGYIDDKMHLFIPCQWKKAYDFCEGLAAVLDFSGKYGFIDKNGKTVIPCEWKSVFFAFKNGLTKVQDFEEEWKYIDKNGEIIWENVGAISDGLIRICDTVGKYGYIDIDRNVVIPCQWDAAEDFCDGLAIVSDYEKHIKNFIDKSGKIVWQDIGDNYEGLIRVCDSQGMYGYIDKDRNVVIPCKWYDANDFCEGLTLVRDSNNMYGYINKNGETVIPFEWTDAFDFYNGIARVSKDEVYDEESDEHYVLIDICGNVVWEDVGWLSDGRIRVCNSQGIYGYLDENYKEVIPCQWKEAHDFHEGLAAVQDILGKYGYIDKNGMTVIPCEWESADSSFNSGLSKVKNSKGEWKYIDKSGTVVWDDVSSLSEDLECVRDSQSLYGYIDKDRKVVIPFQWKKARIFSEGLAAVQDSRGNWGYIDKSGEMMIPVVWRKAYDFNNGLAKVECRGSLRYSYIDKSGDTIWKDIGSLSNGVIRVCDSQGMYGFLDESKNVAIPCQWKKVNDFKEDLALVQDSTGKYGFIDINGACVIPCKWEMAHDFSEGYAAIQNSSKKFGFIDKSGQIAIPAKWDDASDFRNGLAKVGVIVGLGFNHSYINKSGDIIWEDVGPLSFCGFIRVCDSQGMYGYLDESKNVAIPCQWKKAHDFKEDLALVQDSTGKYGFIDINGACVIPCQWDEAYSFKYGMAKIKDIYGKYGFIDKTGDIIIPCEWQSAGDFCGGLSCIIQNSLIVMRPDREARIYGVGLAPVQNSSGKYGYIDKTGNIIIPCQWEKAEGFSKGLALVTNSNKTKSYIDNSGNVVWKNVGVLSEGLERVSNNEGQYGYIDYSSKHIVIPCKWKMAYNFSQGMALVQDTAKQWFFIDKSGKIIWKDVSGPNESLYRVRDSSNKYGYIDKNMKIVISCQWKYAGSFKDGFALVQDFSAKYGYIEKNGRNVIRCQWSRAYNFCDGLALVKDSIGKYGFIDKKGKYVVPCEWSNANSFNCGLAPVLAKGTNWAFIKEKDKWGYIDPNGNVAIPFKWKSAKRFYEDMAAVQDFDDKWGYIDKNGKVVIPCNYQKAEDFSNGLARVEAVSTRVTVTKGLPVVEKKILYVDKNGKIVKKI